MHRQAVNSKVQGSAADIAKMAIICMEHAIVRDNLDARLVLELFDELIYEVKHDHQPAFATLLRQQMEQVSAGMPVRLVANLKSGSDWSSMAPLQLA